MKHFENIVTCHSAFDQEERLNPKVYAVAENATRIGNCDWKDNEQPDVVQHSNSLSEYMRSPDPERSGRRSAKLMESELASSLRLQMQRRRQGNHNPKRDPRWAPDRFCSFGPASTTFVHLYTLHMYCT